MNVCVCGGGGGSYKHLVPALLPDLISCPCHPTSEDIKNQRTNSCLSEFRSCVKLKVEVAILGFPSISLTVSVDVKEYWPVLRHWSQFVLNVSTDIRGHEALHHHLLPMALLDCIAVGTAIAWCGGRCAMSDGHCCSGGGPRQPWSSGLAPVSRFHTSVPLFPLVPVPDMPSRLRGR